MEFLHDDTKNKLPMPALNETEKWNTLQLQIKQQNRSF